MPSALARLISRVRSLFGSADEDAAFAQELDAHVEMATEDNVRRGMTREEARRQALLRVGGRSSLQQRHREARGIPFLADTLQDFRFAFRLMAKDKWFSAAAISAIALGIGANTVGFSIVNAGFLRGFGFDQGDRLFMVTWRPENGRRSTISAPELDDWRAQAKTFSGFGAFTNEAFNISDDTAMPEQTQGARVTADFFDVLRQPPLLGRAFQSGEDQRAAEPVVILGYDIWRNRYNADPGVLGRMIRVNGQTATIVGVMPPRMKFPENTDLWIPFVPTDDQLQRTNRPLAVFGRLTDGSDRQAAEAEMTGIARQMIAAYPAAMKGLAGVRVETFIERFLGGAARPMFITVMGAVMFVLLIACANVANLLLSRSIYRAREIAVRFSMGATRWKIVRQLLIESVVLSAAGGAVGLLLATFGVRAFDAAVQLSQPPYWLHFTIDYLVLAYVAAVCVATGVLFGLAPALHVSKSNNHEVLKEGGRGTAGNRRARSFSGVMVVAELTLTVVLLCGAGLLTRSFIALYSLDPGIDVERLARMRMQLPPSQYPDAAARLGFFEQLKPRLTAIPGVEGAALTTGVPPLDGGERIVEIDAPSQSVDTGRVFVSVVTITPDYFTVVGVPVARGRGFGEADGAPGSETVVVNELLVTRFFPGENPIGKRIRFIPFDEKPGQPREAWRTIVGVSGFIPQGSAQDAYRGPVVYSPFRQEAPRAASILIRSTMPPETVMSEVRRQVQAVDRDQPVFTIQTVAQVFADERRIYSIFATLFAVLAGIALMLSAVGLYAVMAYAVTQRTQEIGVRMAVGAGRWQVSWMFLKRGLEQLLVGLIVGLPAALALAGLVRFRLVEIEPSDPVTFIGITVMLTTVSLAACLVPVLRAAKVDPVVALRSE